MFAKVLQQYTNRVSVTLPDALCDGNCTAEVIGPGWDIECSQSEKPYRLATYEEIQELASDENTFENGTVRPNSTYHGPVNVQMVFEVLVGYNFTASDIEKVADVGGRQVSYSIQDCTSGQSFCADPEFAVPPRFEHHV
jgi:hypothetical protein